MPANPTPIVDVLIPVYNSERTVAASLDSIQQQTFRDIRIVVVDDGSTDNTPTIVMALAAVDPRIKYIRQHTNSGVVDALNLGLSLCTAPYLARHDADDLAYSHRLLVQLDYLEANPDCLAVGAVARHVDTNGNPTGSYARLPPPEFANPRWFPSVEPYLMHPFLMVRRDALAKIGGYRSVFHAQDTDLYWRLQEIGRLHNLPDLLGDYRIHAGSVSNKSVHNARVSALNSQLSAISAVRRRSGQTDLIFPPERLSLYNNLGGLVDLLSLVASDLTSEEQAYLRLAVAAKLVELVDYRIFRFDHTDCVFICNALKAGWHLMTKENASELREKLISLGTKMFYHRRIRELTFLFRLPILTTILRRVSRYVITAKLARMRLPHGSS